MSEMDKLKFIVFLGIVLLLVQSVFALRIYINRDCSYEFTQYDEIEYLTETDSELGGRIDGEARVILRVNKNSTNSNGEFPLCFDVIDRGLPRIVENVSVSSWQNISTRIEKSDHICDYLWLNLSRCQGWCNVDLTVSYSYSVSLHKINAERDVSVLSDCDECKSYDRTFVLPIDSHIISVSGEHIIKNPRGRYVIRFEKPQDSLIRYKNLIVEKEQSFYWAFWWAVSGAILGAFFSSFLSRLPRFFVGATLGGFLGFAFAGFSFSFPHISIAAVIGAILGYCLDLYLRKKEPHGDSPKPISDTRAHRYVYSDKSKKKTYHIEGCDCNPLKRIKPENKRYFGSIEEAESNGYTPCKNCKNREK